MHHPICTVPPDNVRLHQRGCGVPQMSSWGANRRGAIRRKPKKGVEISCRRSSQGVGPDIALTLRSISEAGALLLVTSALGRDEEVEIELRCTFASKPFRLLADVVRVKPVPGNIFCVAVRFHKCLPYADLMQMT